MKPIVLAFCIVAGAASPALSQDDVAAFYKGKVVRLLVGIGVRLGLRHQRAAAGPAICRKHTRNRP